ncbi:hypothetical protein Halar_1174 [halophilic archaeon DL31]|jgi:hypothetical protein|nr:hypothetical protein Halar_1174 [halophilic archaeon DL31]
MAVSQFTDRFRAVDSRLLVGIVGLLYLEVMALTGYWLFSGVTVTDPRYALYGLLWVNVALWVFYRTDLPSASRTTTRRALAVAAGYFGLLAYTGGMIGPGIESSYTAGLAVLWLPPGWGPALAYQGELVRFLLMPARVLGYLALALLVYVTVVDAAASAVSGVLGLLSCVSCTWPVLASISTAIFGGGSFAVAATQSYAYGLSTAVFLLTVLLLSWRPGFGGANSVARLLRRE